MSSANQKEIQSKKSNYNIDDKCNTENSCQNRNRNVFENLKTIIFKEIVALNNEFTSSTKETQMFMKYTKNVLTSGYEIIEEKLLTSLTSENDKNVLSSLSNLIKLSCSALDDLDTEKKQLKILENKGYYTTPVSVFVGNKFERVKRTISGKLKKYYEKRYASFFSFTSYFEKCFSVYVFQCMMRFFHSKKS